MDAADLYLDQVEFERYLTEDECARCSAGSCRALVKRLRGGPAAGSDVVRRYH